MSKKFELTTESIMYFGRTLFRIKALVGFGNVETGELGGYIEKEENLDQSGDAWVSDNARVFDNARVYGNARVSGNACVYGDARVSGNACVYGDARVSGNACVYGDARVSKSTHLLQVGCIGSRYGFTTFYRTKNKRIHVACGCFLGDIDEFEKKVVKNHAGTKHEKTYKAAIELAKAQIEDVEGGE
jgi:hypothetical protein